MKDCKKIHPLLSLYAEGRLSGPDQARAAAHLKDCAQAREESEEFSRLAQSLKRLPEPEFPEGLHERIMARVAGRGKPRSLFGRFWLPGSFGLAAAAAVALLLFIQSPDLLKGPPNLAPSVQQKAELSATRPSVPEKKEAAPSLGPSASQNFDIHAGFAAEEPNVKVPEKNPMAPAAQSGTFRTAKKSPGSGIEMKAFGNVNGSSLGPSRGPGSMAGAAPPRTGATGAMAESARLPVAQAAPPAPFRYHSREEAMKDRILSPEPSRSVSAWSGKNGSNHAAREILADAGAFGKKWRRLLPGRPLPELDFTKQVVVLLETGAEPNPGYLIHVTGLQEKDGRLEVHYRVEAPPAGAVEAQVVSRPWCMRVIPRPEKPVVFVQEP